MASEKIKLAIVALILVVLVINTSIFYGVLNFEKESLKKIDKLTEINQEIFLGDLLYQYYTELDICVSSAGLSEEECKQELSQSTLVEKITKWGGADYIK